MSIEYYMKDPCGTYAIPFEKQKIVIPENMKLFMIETS